MNEFLRKKGLDKGFVYCLYDAHNNICRIGKTERKDGSRQKSQCGHYPYVLEVTTVACNFYGPTETFLHRKFKDKKLKSDWYNISVQDFIAAIEEYKPICKKERKLGVHISQQGSNMYDDRYAINSISPSGRVNFIKIKK